MRTTALLIALTLIASGCAAGEGPTADAGRDVARDTASDTATDTPVTPGMDVVGDSSLPDTSTTDAVTTDTPIAADVPRADTNGEVCDNGRDDNRDGRVDEGCSCLPGDTQECYAGDGATLGRGTCRAGTQTCTGSGELGTWGNCTGAVMPSTDACGDGMDQDCNGTVDDGASCCTAGASESCYSGSSGTMGVGVCRGGTRRCVSGVFGPCEGEVVPSSEVCGSGADENCNGSIDEGCTTCGAQMVTWAIPMGTVGGPTCITTGGGTCVDTLCTGSGCPTRCSSPHCGTLRCNDGSYTRPEYCTVLAMCGPSGFVATGFTW